MTLRDAKIEGGARSSALIVFTALASVAACTDDGAGEGAEDGQTETSGDGDGDPAGDADGDSAGDGDGDPAGDGDGDPAGDGDGDGEPPTPPPGSQPLGDCAPLEGWTSTLVGAYEPQLVWTDGARSVAYERHQLSLFDGQAWVEVAVPGRINQAWARALDDVWIASDKLYHFDGECVSAVLEPAVGLGFSGVTGSADGAQLWAVEREAPQWCDVDYCEGEAASWVRVDGEWMLEDQPLPYYAPKLRYTDETAWSYAHSVARWTSMGWEELPPAYGDHLWSRGSQAWSFYEFGGAMRHFDGQQWTSSDLQFAYTELAPDQYNFRGAFASWEDQPPLMFFDTSDDAKLPALLSLDGVDWTLVTQLPEDTDLRSMISLSADTLLLSQKLDWRGLRYRYAQLELDAPEPAPEPVRTREHRSCNARLFSHADALVGMASGATRARDDEGAWSLDALPDLNAGLHGWMSSASEGWTSGTEGMLRITGPGQTQPWPDAIPQGSRVNGMWGTNASDIYAAVNHYGQDRGWIFHWDGQSWSDVSPEPLAPLEDIHVLGDRVVAIADDLVLTRLGAGEWTRIEPGPGSFERVWVSAEDRVWLSERTQDGARVWSWDGVEWSDTGLEWTAPEGSHPAPLFAGAGDELFMLGGGVLRRFDGLDWSSLDAPDFYDDGSSMVWTGAELVVDDCARIWSYLP